MVGTAKSAANAKQENWLDENGLETGSKPGTDGNEWFAGRNVFEGAWFGTGSFRRRPAMARQAVLPAWFHCVFGFHVSPSDGL